MKFWLAVIGDKKRLELPERTWWCLPMSAQEGDSVFLYCPRSISYSKIKNGIFAEYKISVAPSVGNDKNYFCADFGFRQYRTLGYTELQFLRKFDAFLTAGDMKADPILSKAGFVGKNFQGTTFEISEEHAGTLMKLLMAKQN